MAFWGTIWRTFKYGLPVMTMKEEQSYALFQSFYWKLLPTLDIMRTKNRTWVFTPRCLQGFGLPNIFIEQTIDQIDSLVYHIGSGSFVEDVMIILYEQLQLELGSQAPVLSLDFDRWGYLATPSWMTALWRGASKFNVQLTLFSRKNLPLQCSRDRFLMDQVMALELRADEIIGFNRVCNYIQV